MDKNEVGKTVAESIEKTRGYADFFDWPDKSAKERGIAQTFVEELERTHGSTFKFGKQHPGGANHAPDFQLNTTKGEIWGVEITELVSQDCVHEAKRGKSTLAAWSDQDLAQTLQRIVARKDRPENVRGGPYERYILLVHSDEPMLSAERLPGVLRSLELKTQLIDQIYVLLSYDPRAQRYPLLSLEPHRR